MADPSPLHLFPIKCHLGVFIPILFLSFMFWGMSPEAALSNHPRTVVYTSAIFCGGKTSPHPSYSLKTRQQKGWKKKSERQYSFNSNTGIPCIDRNPMPSIGHPRKELKVQGKSVSFKIKSVPSTSQICVSEAAGYCLREIKYRVAGGRKATWTCSLVSKGMST